jgi:adenylosuccinate lyase
MTSVVEKLVVYPARMQENLDRTRGLVHSQRVMLALTQAGVSREDSYRMVQRNAMRAWNNEGNLLDLLKGDSDVAKALPVSQLEAMFDLGYHLKQVDTIFRRVFCS